MIAITDINELNRIFRKELILQSEVDGEFVRNALSVDGQTLERLMYGDTSESICRCDSVILFELTTRDSDKQISFSETDDEIEQYRRFTFKIIIYGDNSQMVSAKLIARLKSLNVRQRLLSEGIKIERVGYADSVNEYKNETIWQRNDIAIDVWCKLIFSNASEDYTMSSVEIKEIKEI